MPWLHSHTQSSAVSSIIHVGTGHRAAFGIAALQKFNVAPIHFVQFTLGSLEANVHSSLLWGQGSLQLRNYGVGSSVVLSLWCTAFEFIGQIDKLCFGT